MDDIIKRAVSQNIETNRALSQEKHIDRIKEIASAIILSIKRGGKVIIFGNGGSAADAQHMAGELVGRFKKERKGLPAISLTANTSSLTAISNDYSYDMCFSRQVEALARPEDIVIGISTSGNAKNVIKAIVYARNNGIKTVALTGKDGGGLVKEADISFVVPSGQTPSIQEAHILIIHVLCELVEEGCS